MEQKCWVWALRAEQKYWIWALRVELYGAEVLGMGTKIGAVRSRSTGYGY